MAVLIPLVRGAALLIATGFVESVGASVDRLLERARLSPRLANADTETLVPLAGVARFLEEAARDQGVDDLGMRIGASTNVLQLGTFGRLLGSAPTLHEGLETGFRIWSRYNSGERSWLTHHGDQVRLHHQILHEEAAEWEQYAAASLMTYLNYVAAAAGPAWYPTTVALPLRRLPGVRSVPLLANTNIEPGHRWTTITFTAAVLDRPIPRVPGAAQQAASTGWEAVTPATDIGGALRQVVTALLPDGYPDIHLVAEAVRMRPRTLQRRLHAEGSTFAGLVARVRFAEARRLLGDPARKIIDVALDLGYSDPAHFTRAFERWAGVAPREFRRRLLADAKAIAS